MLQLLRDYFIGPIEGFVEREGPLAHAFTLIWILGTSLFLWYGPGNVRGWIVLLVAYSVLTVIIGGSSLVGGFTSPA